MVIAVVVNALLIIGGVIIIVAAMIQRMKTKEMEHRERLAMIEKGIAPGPERPEAFEAWQRRRQLPSRSTSIGVVIVALGLGLMLLIGVAADEVEVGVGVGGAIVMLGAAFIVNGFLHRQSQPPPVWPPATRSEPPGPVAP